MGSAFAQLPADTGDDVCRVGTFLDQDIIDSMQAEGAHPGLEVMLPENVRAYANPELENIIEAQVRLVVFGVGSAGVDWAVARIGQLLKGAVPLARRKVEAICHNQPPLTPWDLFYR